LRQVEVTVVLVVKTRTTVIIKIESGTGRVHRERLLASVEAHVNVYLRKYLYSEQEGQ
jgi:hypothetical protein